MRQCCPTDNNKCVLGMQRAPPTPHQPLPGDRLPNTSGAGQSCFGRHRVFLEIMGKLCVVLTWPQDRHLPTPDLPPGLTKPSGTATASKTHL